MTEPRIIRDRLAEETTPKSRTITPRRLTLTRRMDAQPLHPLTDEPWESPVQLTDGCCLIWNEGFAQPPGKQTVVCSGVVIKDGRATSLLFTSTFLVDADELYRRLDGGGA